MSESQQGELIQGHEYDGIRELDNDLPRWWLHGFYYTIAFAVVYMLYYHYASIGPTPPAAKVPARLRPLRGDGDVCFTLISC